MEPLNKKDQLLLEQALREASLWQDSIVYSYGIETAEGKKAAKQAKSFRVLRKKMFGETPREKVKENEDFEYLTFTEIKERFKK